MFNEKLDLRVCQRDENGKERIIHRFETFDEFFRIYNENYIRLDLVNDPDVRIECYHCRQYWELPGATAYGRVLFDKNDHLYSVERLIGMYRTWRYTRSDQQWWLRGRHGRSRSCWGRFRTMHTAQEIRQSCAITEDEKEVNARPRRTRANIPTAWDDYWVRTQKSWKWQSKRRHQWKPK